MYQSRTGDYQGASNYNPMPAQYACGANIGACGYSYGGAAGASAAGGARKLLQGAGDGASLSSSWSEVQAASTGGNPDAPQAEDYAARYLESLTGGYRGFTWNVVVNNVSMAALGNRKFGLHVLFDKAGDSADAPLPRTADGTAVDVSALRARSDYCTGYTGFNTFMAQHVSKEVCVSERESKESRATACVTASVHAWQ